MPMMKRKAFKILVSSMLSVVALAISFSSNVSAWEFRQFSEIGPPTFQAGSRGPSSQELGLDLRDVPREAIEEAVNRFFQAIENRNFDTLLADNFPDRARLLDVYDETVPQNINIDVLNVSSIATLPGDSIEWLDDLSGFTRTVTVTATVNTQIRFEFEGQQRIISGIGDYFFTVVEEYR